MLNELCNYGTFVTIDKPYAEAVDAAKAALKAEGFGVLCEIDIAETLKEKLGAHTEPYVILGACNPGLAHKALQSEPNLGLLLPCNVVVRENNGTTLVGTIDAHRMLDVASNAALEPIAAEAAARLTRVLDRLNKA